MMRKSLFFFSLLVVLLLVSCSDRSSQVAAVVVPPAETPAGAAPPATTAPAAAPSPGPSLAVSSPTPTQEPAPTAAAAPSPTRPPSPAGFDCGQILPILPTVADDLVTELDVDAATRAALLARAPAAARPALQRLLDAPGSVGLAAYRIGDEAGGAYLNADVPMPLASVVKIIHLVAYAEAVAAGTLDPFTTVPLADLAAFYQPGLDLNAHNNAVDALEARERVFGTPPNVLLDEVPGMMIEFSSNAATDYLHLLLGQTIIEQTAVDLGLTSQTAPCPFLGQFLAMGNHTRTTADDQAAVAAFIADPAVYGQEVMQLTEAFSSDDVFRETAIAWRQETRRPSGQTQRYFSENLNAHGSAADYARLMAILAGNALSNPDSSFIARRYMEWPNRFDANQELFSNVGYKGGSLPGILTTAYYAYPLGEATPVVVTLFFRDLPRETYRSFRFGLAHDELARWLLADPAAIELLGQVLRAAGTDPLD